MSALGRFLQQEDLNFLLTNRIPRRLVTRIAGRLSRVRSRALTAVTLRIWSLLAGGLDLEESEKQSFESLHDCFVRKLKPGARPIDPDPMVVVSPCDGIVGAHGRIRGTELIQAKGFPYRLEDLLPDPELVRKHEDGLFVTLRLRSTMYHRLHAPEAGTLRRVLYVSGDTWNVNPIALQRVERLFCRNERAVLDLDLEREEEALTLVPVAAILVAGIRLHCLPEVLDLRYSGPNELPCSAGFERGDELGYFQHGSTVIVFASGPFRIHPDVSEGGVIRMGTPLFRRTVSP